MKPLVPTLSVTVSRRSLRRSSQFCNKVRRFSRAATVAVAMDPPKRKLSVACTRLWSTPKAVLVRATSPPQLTSQIFAPFRMRHDVRFVYARPGEHRIDGRAMRSGDG